MNKKLKYPLLLTGTINPTINGSPINVESRLESYIRSIERYISETDFNPIIFIENSNYSYDKTYLAELARIHGKDIEFIEGTPCPLEVKKHGKGYGDGLLVYEGLTKSELLKGEVFFYKITGRIFIKNWRKLLKTAYLNRNEFIAYDGMGWCASYIFKANIEDYLHYMSDIYLFCDDRRRRDLEICYWLIIQQNDIQVTSFKTYPNVDGTMGETSVRYTPNLTVQKIKSILAKLGVFTTGSQISTFCWNIYLKTLKKTPYAKSDDKLDNSTI